jgi:hypothetical protein
MGHLGIGDKREVSEQVVDQQLAGERHMNALNRLRQCGHIEPGRRGVEHPAVLVVAGRVVEHAGPREHRRLGDAIQDWQGRIQTRACRAAIGG